MTDQKYIKVNRMYDDGDLVFYIREDDLKARAIELMPLLFEKEPQSLGLDSIINLLTRNQLTYISDVVIARDNKSIIKCRFLLEDVFDKFIGVK